MKTKNKKFNIQGHLGSFWDFDLNTTQVSLSMAQNSHIIKSFFFYFYYKNYISTISLIQLVNGKKIQFQI